MPFDIGVPELLIIFFVVLIVLGPDKIPELARGMGKVMRDVRGIADDFTHELTGDSNPTARRPAQRVCPHCSGLNPLGTLFCGHCGQSLTP